MQSLLMLFIRTYRLAISPFLGHTCRFYPTCSEYAESSLRTHGVLKGMYLAFRRIARCHPWHQGGVDLVPEKTTQSDPIRSYRRYRFLRVSKGMKRSSSLWNPQVQDRRDKPQEISN